jgi:thiol-disulfide isomerase/thioredoxin
VRGAVAALLGALLLTTGTPQERVNAQERASEDRLVKLSEAVAQLNVRDIDGRLWNAAGLRGRVAVIDFWATWCAPCLAEMPTLRRIHGADPSKALVLGINLDVSDRRTLLTWINRHRINWPQVHDRRGYEGDVPRRFDVTSLPMSVLVNPEGRVVAMNLRGDRLIAAVKELVGQDVGGMR